MRRVGEPTNNKIRIHLYFRRKAQQKVRDYAPYGAYYVQSYDRYFTQH